MGWVVAAIVLVVVVASLYVWRVHHTLTRLGRTVDESWSGIAVQLRRRAELVPNVIETARGYAAGERTAFDDMTTARSAIVDAVDDGPVAAASAEGPFRQAMASLLGLADVNPALAEVQGFRQLQLELADTEDKIAASRRFYNSHVATYNTKAQAFPANTFTRPLGFVPREFYDTPDAKAIAQPPQREAR